MNQLYSHKVERELAEQHLRMLEQQKLMADVFDNGELGVVCNLGSLTRRSAHIHSASDNEVWDYKVLKRKNNKATVIRVNGETYQLQHKNQFKGGRK